MAEGRSRRARASEDALGSPSEARASEDALRQRTCVGCRGQDDAGALLRFAYLPEFEPSLVPDLLGKLGGRGLWVHARGACLQKAARGGMARALRRELSVDAGALRAALQSQLTRRIEGLLLAALRRKRVAVGTDAVCEALATCPVSLLLVAKDAAGRRSDVISRASERRVPFVELLDKQALGHLTQREALSFVAILEPNIAREIADAARWLAGLSEDG